MAATAREVAPTKVSLLSKVASKYNIEPRRLMDTLKATAFKVKDGVVTDEQMIALLIVADQYNLNPFTREIFAFPDKQSGGIVPVVSVDGWARIINERDELDGISFEYLGEKIKADGDAKECHEGIKCVIYRKDRAHPIEISEFIDEVYRPAFTGQGKNGAYKKPGSWQTHTKRMLRHKALIQCARVAFGFAGIYDQDEAERIIEAQIIEHPPTQEEPKQGIESVKEKLKAQARKEQDAAAEVLPEGPGVDDFNQVPPDAAE